MLTPIDRGVLGCVAFLSSLLPVAPLLAQSAEKSPAPSQAVLKARLDAKRGAAFLKAHGWHLSFAGARKAAVTADKPVLIYFTRSDVPAPVSDALEKQIFSAPGFATIAERVVLCCNITSRVQKAPDQDLFERYGGSVFPRIVITDGAGNRIGTSSRISSIADLTGVLDGEVAEFLRLRAGAAKGEPKAKAAYFMRRLELGHLQPPEIEKELATADYLSEIQRRMVKRSLANLEVMSVLNAADVSSPAGRKRVVKRFLAMVGAGRIPSDRFAFPMWQVLIGHADIKQDAVLFRRSLNNIKRIAGKKVDAKWLKRMSTRLQALEFFAKRDKQDRK